MAAGIHKYTVAEGVGLQLGQAGFKELTSAGNTGDGTFCAFYVTGDDAGNLVTVAATTHTGDNLTATPFLVGSLVYGPFKKITTTSHTDTEVHVLCYYG